MDELQRKLKERRETKQPKPHQRMAPIGRNYGTGRTAQQARAFTGMAYGKPRGDARAYHTGNIMVASRGTRGTEQSETIGFASNESLQLIKPTDEVFIVARRAGVVNYTGDDIPQPPDDDETIMFGTQNVRPNQPSDSNLMDAFLERCMGIRGNLPPEPDENVSASQINTALKNIMMASIEFGVLVTIYPAFDDNGVVGNVDWEDTRAYPHSPVNFSAYNYFLSAGAAITQGNIPISPAVMIYNAGGEPIAYPSARVGDLLRFVYFAFYLQAVPTQFQPTEPLDFARGFPRFWAFWAQAFGDAIGDLVTGDPNRRPRRDGLEKPVASQYAIGNGTGRHAKTQVTVEFSRYHLGTFPLRNSGCDVLLANDMNVRKIRYNNGAIIADYLMSPQKAKKEYPFLEIRNMTQDAAPDQQNTPAYHTTPIYSHFMYRNRYGSRCYGGENSVVSENSGGVSLINHSNIGNLYSTNELDKLLNDGVSPKVDVLFTADWLHQVRFTNPLTINPAQRAFSPDFFVNSIPPKSVSVNRFVWVRGSVPAARQSTIQKNSTQFSCRGLGLTPNKSEVLPATQFDPGARKYTSNLPNEYRMGVEGDENTTETSGWQFTHIVFVKRKP